MARSRSAARAGGQEPAATPDKPAPYRVPAIRSSRKEKHG